MISLLFALDVEMGCYPVSSCFFFRDCSAVTAVCRPSPPHSLSFILPKDDAISTCSLIPL